MILLTLAYVLIYLLGILVIVAVLFFSLRHMVRAFALLSSDDSALDQNKQ